MPAWREPEWDDPRTSRDSFDFAAARRPLRVLEFVAAQRPLPGDPDEPDA
jgi:hypothetical protein